MLPGFVPWPEKTAERYREAGYWRGEVLGDLLPPEARRDSSRTALITSREEFTYAELDDWSSRIRSGLLRHGIGSGDRVLVQLPNIPEFVALSIALFRVGAIPVYALPAHREAEISHLCAHAGVTAYVIPNHYHRYDYRRLAREVRRAQPSVREVFVVGAPEEFTAFTDLAAESGDGAPSDPVDPSAPALLLLSGGTTGSPKLIARTHDDYGYQMRATAEAMRFGPGDVYLAALPVAHNAALGCPGVLGALRAGGTVALAETSSPDEVFPLVTRSNATMTTLMPSILRLWADTAGLFGADLSGLVVEVGGAPLTADAARETEARLGCTLTRWFGMAEGPLLFTRPGSERNARLSTEGWPLSEADELRVVDEQDRDVNPGETGELLVRGPTTLRGYYASPDYNARAFTDDGFLRTGDLVSLSCGGLVVRGRAREVINHGGEKVPPQEVEQHLLAHPDIEEAAVVGFPDQALGEKTCAVVVPAGPSPSLSAVRDFLVGVGLAEFKLPDRLRVVSELPRTSTGKVDKRQLTSVAADRGGVQGASDPASVAVSSPPNEA